MEINSNHFVPATVEQASRSAEIQQEQTVKNPPMTGSIDKVSISPEALQLLNSEQQSQLSPAAEYFNGGGTEPPPVKTKP